MPSPISSPSTGKNDPGRSIRTLSPSTLRHLIALSFPAVELARPGMSSLVMDPERIQHLWEDGAEIGCRGGFEEKCLDGERRAGRLVLGTRE